MTRNEIELYPIIKEFLKKHFSNLSKKHYFEITAKKFSNKIKNEFDTNTLLLLKTEGAFPDIMGFVEKGSLKEWFVFEIKDDKPTISAIYQTKKYAEVLGALHAYLICTKPMSAELKRILSSKPILSYSAGYHTIGVVQFDKEKKGIILDESFFTYDDPLKC